MKLGDQVCSIELAKKLKALEVQPDSKFFWLYDGSLITDEDRQARSFFIGDNCAAAFTVAELGEMLPTCCESYRNDRIPGHQDRFVCITHEEENDHYEYADTEADARAKMLVYLIEKGIVKP